MHKNQPRVGGHGRGHRRSRNPPPPPIPNGNIDTSVQLAWTLRYFRGESPYDIMAKHGVFHTELLDSVWYVVEAVNAMKQWCVTYPLEREKFC